ncbi:MAG: hypothetical protein ACLQIQ_09225 [Beijerinckiaceae bacterium]
MQNPAKLAAIVAETAIRGTLSFIDPEAPANRIIAHVTGLDDDQILTVMGMRAVPVRRDFAADPPMVEGESAEMLHQQNDRIALALVGAERPRRHHARPLETQG